MKIQVHFCQDKECRKIKTKEYDLTPEEICTCMKFVDFIECMTEAVLDKMALEWCGTRNRECIEGYKSAQGEAAWDSVARAIEAALKELVMRFSGV
ncbi:MAG: hypothetical protein JZD41_07640 [Thermoproteus sp.]|nr:hypothetical protein [Thermoproteus sp.]